MIKYDKILAMHYFIDLTKNYNLSPKKFPHENKEMLKLHDPAHLLSNILGTAIIPQEVMSHRRKRRNNDILDSVCEDFPSNNDK